MLVAGDFNMTRKESDKNKPRGYNKWSMLFNYIIIFGEMMELPLVGRKYTWSNKQKHPILEKLDRILMNPTWEDLFPMVTVRKLVRDVSDHNPLLLTTNPLKNSPGPCTCVSSDLNLAG